MKVTYISQECMQLIANRHQDIFFPLNTIKKQKAKKL